MNNIAVDWDRHKHRNPEIAREYDRLNRQYREQIAMLHDTEDILEFLRTSIYFDYWHRVPAPEYRFSTNFKTPLLEYYRSTAYGAKLTINTYNIPYEIVVEKIAGPLHRRFGVYWTLDAFEDHVTLHSVTDRKIELLIQIRRGVNKCHLKVVKTESHSDNWTSHKYALDCGGE